MELISKWIDLINEEDPDFITGYNILGFDFNYIHTRANELFKKSEKNISIKGYKKREIDSYNLGRIRLEDSNKYWFKKSKYMKKNNFKDIEVSSFNDLSFIILSSSIAFRCC